MLFIVTFIIVTFIMWRVSRADMQDARAQGRTVYNLRDLIVVALARHNEDDYLDLYCDVWECAQELRSERYCYNAVINYVVMRYYWARLILRGRRIEVIMNAYARMAGF